MKSLIAHFLSNLHVIRHNSGIWCCKTNSSFCTTYSRLWVFSRFLSSYIGRWVSVGKCHKTVFAFRGCIWLIVVVAKCTLVFLNNCFTKNHSLFCDIFILITLSKNLYLCLATLRTLWWHERCYHEWDNWFLFWSSLGCPNYFIDSLYPFVYWIPFE